MEPMVFWYVVATVTNQQHRVCQLLREEGLHAFLPKMENYRNDRKEIEEKLLYPGYVFVKDSIGREEFYRKLHHAREKGSAYFCDLGKDVASALSEMEQDLFEHLLDEEGVVRISHAYKEHGRAVVVEGPLVNYQNEICKLDRHASMAYLNLEFLDKRIQAGILMDGKMPPKVAKENESVMVIDSVEVDLEELKRQMMGL